MPRSKNPDRYPIEFFHIFQAARKEKQEQETGSPSEARRVANSLLAFRVAWESSKQLEWKTLREVSVKIEGSKVILQPDRFLQAIRKAGEGPTEEELDAMAKAFDQAITGRKEEKEEKKTKSTLPDWMKAATGE